MSTAPPAEDGRVEAAVLRLTAARGPDKSICPSEAARALSDDWRPLLGAVRQAAIRLAQADRIEILRKGKPIDPAAAHGVIRLRARSGALESED